jgi:hypothetical protein
MAERALQGRGWGRIQPRPGRVRSRYANFWLPDRVSPAMAIGHGQAAIGGGGLGWHPDGRGYGVEGAVGYASSTHRSTGLQLVLLVAGIRPLIISVGQRGGRAPREDVAVLGQALRNIAAAYRALGGWIVTERDLLGLVRQAQVHADWLVAAEQRVEQLTPCLTHRACPLCRAWSRYEARWCHACRYEFTPQDNFARDDARARAEREIGAFQAQSGPGAPPPPPSARPARATRA